MLFHLQQLQLHIISVVTQFLKCYFISHNCLLYITFATLFLTIVFISHNCGFMSVGTTSHLTNATASSILKMQIYVHVNCNFCTKMNVFHNCDFISHNCNFISQICKFISHKHHCYSIYNNCNFIFISVESHQVTLSQFWFHILKLWLFHNCYS